MKSSSSLLEVALRKEMNYSQISLKMASLGGNLVKYEDEL